MAAGEYAPSAIAAIYPTVHAHIASAEYSGIVGNGEHTYGYHRSRNRLIAVGQSGDYSIQAAQDKKGDGNAASALDIKMSTADMIKVSRRLIQAGLAKDPRLKALREFFGTVDGRTVTGYSPYRGRYVTSSDKSHLWHVHLSIHREWANDRAELQNIAAVIVGAPGSVSAVAPTKPATPIAVIPATPDERDFLDMAEHRYTRKKAQSVKPGGWHNLRIEDTSEDVTIAFGGGRYLVNVRVNPKDVNPVAPALREDRLPGHRLEDEEERRRLSTG